MVYGTRVAVRADGGAYVMADQNDQDCIKAVSDQVRDWEAFTIFHADKPWERLYREICDYDPVAFLAHNGRFIMADFKRWGDEGVEYGELHAYAREVKEWERFIVRFAPGGVGDRGELRVTLQDHEQRFLMCHRQQRQQLVGYHEDIRRIGTWEVFDIVPLDAAERQDLEDARQHLAQERHALESQAASTTASQKRVRADQRKLDAEQLRVEEMRAGLSAQEEELTKRADAISESERKVIAQKEELSRLLSDPDALAAHVADLASAAATEVTACAESLRDDAKELSRCREVLSLHLDYNRRISAALGEPGDASDLVRRIEELLSQSDQVLCLNMEVAEQAARLSHVTFGRQPPD